MPQKRVSIMVGEGIQALDVAGPLDVFAEANRHVGHAEGYVAELVAVHCEPMRTSNGSRIVADVAFEEAGHGSDILLVAGGEPLLDGPPDRAALDWLASAAARAGVYGAICTGAFALGYAGLLDHRRATTHWRAAPALAETFPLARVEADRIFLRDGRLITSAGVTAGIDLALALVAEHHGAQVALAVAKHLVVVSQRRGGQSQFSPLLAPPPREDSLLARVQAYVVDHMGSSLSVDELAGAAGMSVRSFSRHFVDEAGITPREFVERARLDAARTLLEAGELALKAVAYYCGFGDADRMRVAFTRRLGVTPAQYREGFHRQVSA